MKRSVLSEEELSLLGALGRLPLHRVFSPVWEGIAEFGNRLVAFLPDECVLVKGDNRLATRIQVSLEPPEEPSNLELAAQDLGSVTNLEVLETLVGFSPWYEASPTDILGVPIPAGRGASVMYLHPDNPAAEDISAKALSSGGTGFASVHLGVRFRTDGDRDVTFYTDGVGYFVHLAIDEGLKRLSENVLRYRPLAGP